MSSIGSPSPFFLAGKKAYQVERSLRFNSGDSPYLAYTPSGAGSNQMTFSFWMKRGNLGTQQTIFSSGEVNARAHIYFYNDKLTVQPFNSTGANGYIETNRVFRDPSAWYHIVISFNNAAYNNMASTINVYVNNVAATFTTHTTGTPTGGNRLNDAQAKKIGEMRPDSGSHFDGYLTEFNFIDGQALTPASFGETNATTGQWNPIEYTGSYGNQGFYLNFSDNSGTTATTLGKDSSGNGNNFTPNNFSVNAGQDDDSLEDTPTNNFPTFNPLYKNSSGSYEGNASLTNGNLAHSSVGSETNAYATFALPSSGKYYWEVRLSSINTASIGIIVSSGNANRSILFNQNGTIFQDNASAQTGLSSWSGGDVIGIAYNGDSQTLQFYRQGSSQGSALNITAFTESYFPLSRINAYADINFGQRAFSYTPPTGYKKLNSANLPDPTILLPNKHFNTLLYTGNSTDARAITGVGFSPDWVWIKNRDDNDWNNLYDTVRGAGKRVATNSTSAEHNSTDHMDSIDSDGFTLKDGDNTNQNGEDYVSWNWNAGDTDGKTYTVTVVSDSGNKFRFDGFGTSAVTLDLAEGGTYIFNYPSGHPFRFSTTADGTHGGGSEYTTGVTVLSSTSIQIVVAASAPNLNYYCSSHSGMGGAINTNSTLGSSNFDGSTQSIVKVNATAGFSMVAYTGTGSTTTVGHGLGVKPDFMIFRNRNSEGHGWNVYHSVLGATKNLQLNTNSPEATASNKFNNTEPTSSVFTVSTAADTNQSSQSFISYIFTEVEGFSKFGFYDANSSNDGEAIYSYIYKNGVEN